MKIALLLLVLLNVFYMSWANWVAPEPRDAIVVTPEPKAAPLVLFAEQYPERAQALRDQAAAQAAQAAEDMARAQDDAAATADSASEVATPDAQTSVDDVSALDSVPAPDSAPAQQRQSQDEAAPASPVPAAAALTEVAADDSTIVEIPANSNAAKTLIDAAVATGSAASAARAEPLVALTDDGPATARCVKLGPFLTLRAATDAADRLRSVALAPTQRLEEAKVWVGHWVYLPAHPTRAAAVATVEKLRADGVSDIYIEPSGEMRNVISLGLFSDAEGAEIRAGKVRKLGVKPEIRDRYRDGSVYWVDFRLEPGQNLDPAQFGAEPNRRISLLDQPCDDAAGRA